MSPGTGVAAGASLKTNFAWAMSNATMPAFYLCNWKSYLMGSLGPPTLPIPSRVMSFKKMCMDAKVNKVLQTHFKRPKKLLYSCVRPLSHWHCLIVAMCHEISPPFGNAPFLDSVNADVCKFTTKLLTLRYCTWPWSLKLLPRSAQKPWVQHERKDMKEGMKVWAMKVSKSN